MHKGLKAFFDEHERPRHADKRQCHDHLAPVVRLAALEQKQVLEFRTLITEAGLSPDHSPELDGKLEHIHQTFGAWEREANALAVAARNLVKARQQFDRYMAEWRQEIGSIVAAAGKDKKV